MFRSHWLHRLLGRSQSRKARRRLTAQQRRSFRPMLESLEDRITPAQTAGSFIDLINAIAVDTAPNTNYVIAITSSFTFNAGQQAFISNLDPTSTLTIEGQNGSNYTLTGSGNRLFDVGNANKK